MNCFFIALLFLFLLLLRNIILKSEKTNKILTISEKTKFLSDRDFIWRFFCFVNLTYLCFLSLFSQISLSHCCLFCLFFFSVIIIITIISLDWQEDSDSLLFRYSRSTAG
jgi:uncharacterized membrane protein